MKNPTCYACSSSPTATASLIVGSIRTIRTTGALSRHADLPHLRRPGQLIRLVEEGKLTPQEAERLQALATQDTGSLAINVLMSFGAVAVAAGIIALEPAFMTGAVLGVALVAIGVGISFLAARLWGLVGTATTIIGALLLAVGVIGFAEADFAGLALNP
jgi:hypothetical protein